MTPEFAAHVCKEAIYTTLLVAAPMLIAGLIVGVAISLFQAVTQVHELTLTFIPKILAVVGVMLVVMPWMIRVLLGFTRQVFTYATGGVI
ncbi:MAG: flagellar biosynthesis protein FliQ [Calditrichaeota bacterium]|nr:flagellar biosynthesis protein FliQ [Calditrichota bacterium]